jgi:Ethanolamine utilization protein EutJ (predicted chaperonin)
MTRVFVSGMVLLILAGCASSPSESEVQIASAVPASATAAEAIDNPEAVEDGLHVVDVPDVQMAASVTGEAAVPLGEKLICKREKTTGSHRTTRICRTRADIERRREDDQQMIRDIQSTPQGSRVR